MYFLVGVIHLCYMGIVRILIIMKLLGHGNSRCVSRIKAEARRNIRVAALRKQFLHRLTNGNCTPPVRRLGYEKHQSGYSPFVAFFSATFLQPWSCLRKPLFGLQKRQLPKYVKRHKPKMLAKYFTKNICPIIIFIKGFSMEKMKVLIANNRSEFVVFIGINLALVLFVQILAINSLEYLTTGFSLIIYGLLFVGVIFNRIVFFRNVLKKIFVNNINNIFTIFINLLKCYAKYLLIGLAILTPIYIIGYFVLFFMFDNERIAAFLSIFIVLLAYGWLLYMFYKLLFIEHILVQKQESYKTKRLVEENFNIIKHKKSYILKLYSINGFIFLSLGVTNVVLPDLNLNNFLWIIFLIINFIYTMLILLFYVEISKRRANCEGVYSA